MNIAEILPRTAKRLPDKIAFVFNDQPTRYKALQDLTEAFAHGLQKLGVEKGDRVAVFAPSSLEFVVSWFSVVKLGAVFVPVNIMLKARESKYILENAEVNTLIVHQSQGEIIQSIRPGLKNMIVIGNQTLPDSLLFSALLAEKPVREMTVDCAPDDTATMIYTSGTTGFPKGAMITHGNFDSNVKGIIVALNLDEEMVRVSVTPLFHAMGLTVNMLAVVMLGATAVIQAKLDFEEFLKANEKYSATMISGAPTLHYMLVNDPRT
ncbi:MAG TPA: class I adenylate-forming enzyme family protein, partial [Thermodesulfobacteriota bacterium]|nr:class I adenylate-forming enzyme family protein [Thermodesulfobacteriota bacterium]